MFSGIIKTIFGKVRNNRSRSGQTNRLGSIIDLFIIWSPLIIEASLRLKDFIKPNRFYSVGVNVCNKKSIVGWKFNGIDVSSYTTGGKVVQSFEVKFFVVANSKCCWIKLKYPNSVVLSMEWDNPNSLSKGIINWSDIVVVCVCKTEQMVGFSVNISYHSSVDRLAWNLSIISNKEDAIIKPVLRCKGALIVSSRWIT